jgi:RNA polymerase sigma-70 factor (ECF subfamily)
MRMTDPSSTPPFADMLARAREGSVATMGQLLEIHREHLLALAHHRIPRDLNPKMQPSDAVQVTLMSAHLHFEQFRGGSAEEFSEWLLTILLNTIRDFVRSFKGCQKQLASREVPLDAALPAAEAAFCRHRSPSACDRLIEQEEHATFRRCLELLPEAYRQVLRLRFDDDLGFQEIGAKLGVTAEAARKLRTRALRALSKLLRAHRIIDDAM